MSLSKERAVEALNGCLELNAYRRGVLKNFLCSLTENDLAAAALVAGINTTSDDEIAGFLDDYSARGVIGLHSFNLS